jgi:hypothetical protein
MDDKPVIRQLIGNDFAPPRIILDVDDPDDVPAQPCRFCPSRFILCHIGLQQPRRLHAAYSSHRQARY